MLIGTDGVYSYTFTHEKRDDCPVCGGEALEMTIKPDTTVEQLIDILVEKQDMYVAPFTFVQVLMLGLLSVKSRSLRYPQLPNKSTSKLLHS